MKLKLKVDERKEKSVQSNSEEKDSFCQENYNPVLHKPPITCLIFPMYKIDLEILKLCTGQCQ